MAEISVIVPVYKVEPYLHKCVDSILEQSFSDIQVILVDDGSPDSCGDICEEYAQKDTRVQVVHKENGGLSDARNAGIAYTEGNYVIFLDSDDYIERDMLEYLYTNIKTADADMATCGIYEVYKDRIEAQEETPGFVCTGEEAFRCILQGHTIRGEIWNKLIKKECMEDLRFPKGRLYEDIYYTVDLMQRIKKVA
ncbi:glycosyltransferase family 2 protein, partial [Mediterraneibacter massiliensis]